jgi:hypothetical protein
MRHARGAGFYFFGGFAVRITKLVAGAGLALTLSAFSPAVFAQTAVNNPPASGSAASNGSSANTATGSDMNSGSSAAENSNTAAQSNEGAENNNAGAMKQESSRQEARDVEHQLKEAHEQGKDVSAAKHEYRLGMRDMRKGNDADARQHFEQAKNELNNQKNSSESNNPTSESNSAINPNGNGAATSPSGPTTGTAH